MTAHTPGPWVYTGFDIDGPDKIDGSRCCIASMTVSRRAPETEQAANARLIAAAPDLLAALRGMLAAFEGWGETTSPACTTARAAIAKATS